MPPRVLVTRAPHQASELAEGLRAAGMEPILIPTIELAPPLDRQTLPAALAKLHAFHWLLFTSANAFARLSPLEPSTLAPQQTAPPLFSSLNPSSLDVERTPLLFQHLKIAAIGPATARALTALHLTPDLIPPHAVAESLAAALLSHARQKDGQPTRFLLIRAEQARDHLPETLRAAGAEVTLAPAYRNVTPSGSVETLRTLFSKPENYPVAITFTSSSTASNLLGLLQSVHVELPPQILRASIGPITSQTLVTAGFPPQIEAETPTVAALVAALKKVLV
jgi:uroporphyrinogen-III synthase